MDPRVIDKIKNFYLSAACHYSLIALGTVLRVKHYLENRSLWLDEAYVALEVVGSRFDEILRYVQIFPEQAKSSYLFYLLEKCVTVVLGNGEAALRLWPLICGLLSILIFYRIIKTVLTEHAVPVALGLFVLCDAFVYYSAEVKQYSPDVLVTLILYGAFIRLLDKEWEARHVLGLWALVTLTIWSSFSAIIVLVSMGMILLVDKIMGSKRMRLIDLFGILVVCAVNFLLLFKVCLEPMFRSSYISGSIREKFLNAPIVSVDALVWIGDVCAGMMRYPGGLIFPLLCWALVICGAVELYRRSPRACAAFVLPFVLTLAAALAGKYPFFGRHVLFLLPGTFILIAAGVVFAAQRLCACGVVPLVLVALLLANPVDTAVSQLRHPRAFEQTRPVMEHFKQHYQPGDFVYMNTSAQYPYWYYVSLLQVKLSPLNPGVWRGEYVYGHRAGRIFEDVLSSDKEKAVAFVHKIDQYNKKGIFRQPLFDQSGRDIRFLSNTGPNDLARKKRVWLILSHINPRAEAFILKRFDQEGRRLSQYVRKGAAVYLYDLTYP